MWARRCGVPKHWPSRIRVTIHSFINAAVGFAIFKYLTAADVGYLDLSSAVNDRVLCLSAWPLRYHAQTLFQDDAWIHWANAVFDTKDFVKENQCPLEEVTSKEQGKCDSARIPVPALQRNLGYAIGQNINMNSDVIAMYSGLFMYIGLLLFATTAIHDISLLTVRNNSYILDMQGVRRNFPTFVRLAYCVAGVHCFRRLANSGQVGRIVSLVLIPFAFVWGLFVFCAVVWPLGAVIYWLYPVRLSRLAVFFNALLMCIYGIAMIIHSLVWLSSDAWRPNYAITWTPPEGECVCGCVFHAARGSILQVLFIGVSVTFKAFMIAFRCLKGLRRTNWASLLTVMFPVPLAVYPVRWTQPDGSPIMHRQEDEPVQGELAFDPFALMDEQPESAHTTVKLVPTVRDEEELAAEQELAAPSAKTIVRIGSETVEHIGCCGFPYLSTRARIDEEKGKDETD